jgi:L-threonylcarbamoyladenylate synthase
MSDLIVKEDLDRIRDILISGGTILYPTDTIWGLGCDATNEEACQKLMELKNRPKDKSFILLVDGFLMLEKYVPEFPEVCYDLADLATNPLTIVYPTATQLAASVLAEDGSVGIRITKDPICLQLIRAIKRPLVSTSANLSGEPFPINFASVNSQLKQAVDAVVEKRTNETMTKPSQVIKIGKDSSVKVLRK